MEKLPTPEQPDNRLTTLLLLGSFAALAAGLVALKPEWRIERE